MDSIATLGAIIDAHIAIAKLGCKLEEKEAIHEKICKYGLLLLRKKPDSSVILSENVI